MNTYPKDNTLRGKYVKRCKCGARPYHDRIATTTSQWIARNCGRTGVSAQTIQEAIENWNKGRLTH